MPAEDRGTVLFLCTGNYFRSRFAELFFNHHACVKGADSRAISRGIALEFGRGNIGPISRHTLRGLARHGISPREPIPMPRQLEECDLLAAAHIVAVKENEHRPMLARRFPHWVDRVEYWRVDDIEDCHPDDALALLEFEVSRLLLRISNDPGDLQSSDR